MGETVSWGYVDLTDWIPVDSDTYLGGYGSTLRILKSTLIAYTIGGSDLQKAELGIIDLVSKTKTVKYKFDTLLGTYFIRFYDKTSGKYKTIGGWGMAGTGAPCGNNGNIYVIDSDGNIDVKCMPYSNYYGNVGICFYDSKTNYIYCGGDACGRRIYRLKPDGSYDSDWSASNMQSGCGVVALIPATETDLYLLESTTSQYAYKATVDVLNNWKSTQYIENAFTQLTINTNKMIVGWTIALVNKKYFVISGDVAQYTQDFVNFNTVTVPYSAVHGIYLDRLILSDSNKIYIYNPTTFTTEATISITDSVVSQDRTSDPPFFITIDTTNRRFKVRALTYNNMIPMIQYDPVNGVRVIDILTGNPAIFKINVFYSRFLYPINIQPMRDPDFVLEPSGFTPLPNPPSSDRTVANMWISL